MKTKEKVIENFLMLCALVTVVTTVSIIVILSVNTVKFFSEVSIVSFFTDTQWTPLFEDKHFGILPLVSGTLLTTAIAVCVALPLGLTIAIYLNEYAPKRFASIAKPILEILAAVPTVVYGFFALTFLTPVLQTLIPSLPGFNALSAGLVMGLMIIPYVSSLSEEALRAVPQALREASYGIGATKFQTAFRVLVPAAASGITVSMILAISRAIGETMIVAIAAGQEPKLTFNPMRSVETITAYIVQVSMGDVAQNSLEYDTIFSAGLTLFVFTFVLNNIGIWIRQKYHQQYE